MRTFLTVFFCSLLLLVSGAGAGEKNFQRTQDVIYGRKFGMALTMDVFTPAKNPNGAAVIVVISGGWFSDHKAINTAFADPFLKRGYTDFLNYGKKGNVALGRGTLSGFRAPFDFHELDKKTRSFMPVTDEDKILAIGKDISPIYHVTKDDPPTLIIHGDADKLVPIQQAETIIAKFKDVGVPAELVVRKGAGHGWVTLLKDINIFADWFDKHLQKKSDQ